MLNRKSVTSNDDNNSIEDNDYLGPNYQPPEPSKLLTSRAHRYRNSIAFPPVQELVVPTAEVEKERLRFPSFESTNDSHFYNYLTKIDGNFFGDRRMYNEIAFDLENDAKALLSNARLFNEVERKTYGALVNNRGKGAAITDKSLSIGRYKAKKIKRKMTYKIRYKVRQDLAIKRLRNKGKFIKSKKMDLRTAANMILNGSVIRDGRTAAAQELEVDSDSQVHPRVGI